MKPRKVLNVRTHIGGLHGKISFDSIKDGADMEVCQEGVLIKSLNEKPLVKNGVQYFMLMPFPNCTEILIEAVEQEELKRGPGRPPRSQEVVNA